MIALELFHFLRPALLLPLFWRRPTPRSTLPLMTSVPRMKYLAIRPTLHPAWRRFESLEYSRYSRSSCLASPAHRRPWWRGISYVGRCSKLSGANR